MEKPTFGEKFRALLATGRVANLPTVWSNVLVGFWLASYFVQHYNLSGEGPTKRFFLLIILMLITSMIYVGGCMLGDAKDIQFDRENRPNRPLPRGVLSVGFIKFTSYSCFILAIFGLFSSTYVAFVGAVFLTKEIPIGNLLSQAASKEALIAIQIHEMILGLLLLGLVIGYAFFHKKNKPSALIMMASCRSLLVLLAIGAAYKTFLAEPTWSLSRPEPLSLRFDWLKSWMLVLAASVGIYTLLLSWVASTESKPGPFHARNMLAGLLLGLPLLSLLFNELLFSSVPEYRDIWAEEMFYDVPYHACIYACVLALFYVWLLSALRSLKTSKPAFVSKALAGFCLLDACFVAAFAPDIALICLGFFGLALLLQRFAPAT